VSGTNAAGKRVGHRPYIASARARARCEKFMYTCILWVRWFDAAGCRRPGAFVG